MGSPGPCAPAPCASLPCSVRLAAPCAVRLPAPCAVRLPAPCSVRLPAPCSVIRSPCSALPRRTTVTSMRCLPRRRQWPHVDVASSLLPCPCVGGVHCGEPAAHHFHPAAHHVSTCTRAAVAAAAAAAAGEAPGCSQQAVDCAACKFPAGNAGSSHQLAADMPAAHGSAHPRGMRVEAACASARKEGRPRRHWQWQCQRPLMPASQVPAVTHSMAAQRSPPTAWRPSGRQPWLHCGQQWGEVCPLTTTHARLLTASGGGIVVAAAAEGYAQMPNGMLGLACGWQQLDLPCAAAACTTCSAVCGSWEPPASLTAALQAGDAEQPADIGSLGVSQLLGSAGIGLGQDEDAGAAAAGAADCAGEEEEEGEEDAGSERPSKRRAQGSQVLCEGSAAAAGPAGGMTCAPAVAGDQPWQQAAHLFSALLQASGLPAGGGGRGSGGGRWTLPLHAGGLAGFGSAAPFGWPLPSGAAGGSPYSAQLALGPGASLFNASAAAAGPPPSRAMPQPPSALKSAKKVHGQGPACNFAGLPGLSALGGLPARTA